MRVLGYIGIYTHTLTSTHVHTYGYSKQEMTEYSDLDGQNVSEPNAIASCFSPTRSPTSLQEVPSWRKCDEGRPPATELKSKGYNTFFLHI